jgi:hypothetical protein
MANGRKKSWKYALNELTDNPRINVESLISYFKPLYDWLKVN